MSHRNDAEGTAARDVLLLAMLGFVCVIILLLPHINPPPEPGDEDPPASLMVEIRWPDGIDTDVDLWVKAPGQRPVGYSHKSGPRFNLLRDDLGNTRDYLGLNYENAYARGLVDGEWIVTVHLYHDRSAATPVPVKCRIAMMQSSRWVTVLEREVTLDYIKQEVTVSRFWLRDGSFIRGLENQRPAVLRQQQAATP